jgi:hypothetical protein
MKFFIYHFNRVIYLATSLLVHWTIDRLSKQESKRFLLICVKWVASMIIIWVKFMIHRRVETTFKVQYLFRLKDF